MKFLKSPDEDTLAALPLQRAAGSDAGGRTDGETHGTGGNDFIHPAGDGRHPPPGYHDVPFQPGGVDHIVTGAGDDIVYCSGADTSYVDFGVNLTAKDQVFGAQHVILNGGYSFTEISASTLVLVGEVDLMAGHDYNLSFGAGISNSFAFYFLVDASPLGAADRVTFTAAAELDNPYHLVGGAGDDVMSGSQAGPGDLLVGGAGDDKLFGLGGADQFIDGAGNDTYSGGDAGDLFYMYGDDEQTVFGSGDDTVLGGAGNDAVIFHGEFHTGDRIDGGVGYDTILLEGNYTGAVLSGSWIRNVEAVHIEGDGPGAAVDFVTDDGLVKAGKVLTVDGSFNPGTLTFDGSAETDGRFAFIGSTATDIFTGGAQDDTFTFNWSTNPPSPTGFSATDRLDGGAGDDRLVLDGSGYGGGVVLEADTIHSIETIVLGSRSNDQNADYASFQLVMNDGNVAAGETLTLRGEYILSLGSITFDGSAETDGRFVLTGGAGKDVLIGGAQSDVIQGGGDNDTLTGGLGADTLNGGAGKDVFVYRAAQDSTGAGFDRVVQFDARDDRFDLSAAVTRIDAEVEGGKLTAKHFDNDLALAIGSGQLKAHHAVLFAPDAGNLAGQTFLVIDINGVAGYQAGTDLVIELAKPADLAHLSTASFF